MHPLIKIGPAHEITAGDLRAATEDLPDETRIVLVFEPALTPADEAALNLQIL
jgi:hypothetical protein